MAEMGEALRSCMERLVIAREEREQIIVEAANEISSEKKKVRELQQKLEDANKKVAKLAAENNHLSKAADSKDALIGELRESAAATGNKLADATARLESAQKQAGSLQYEVRMLQKELEVRGQEREYDLKSVDAARRQQAEHLKRIAELEAECQRLRAMVRKRLPGPAAIAKMRDEVDQQPTQTPTSASPRRPRLAMPSSPRSVVAPRTPSPRRSSVSDAEGYAFKLRAVEDENKALKQALAKRESELQFMQIKYADEACKLTVAQRQLKELTEENRQLSDANSQSESWASALVSELDKFRSGNQNGAPIMAPSSSEMNLLDDFAEIEKLEMASGDQKRNAQRASLKKADTGLVTKEQNGSGPVLDGSISNGHTEKVKNIWELVVHRHEASGESVETIIEQISQALDQTAISAKRDDSVAMNDRSEIEKAVRNMVEEITSMIRTSAEDNVARSRVLLHNKSELFRRLEHLVHFCHDLLEGKCNLGKFIDEVCLVLKYIVSQYFSDQDQTDSLNSNTENFDGVKSLSTVPVNGTHDTESAKPAAKLGIQTEAEEEPVQSVESKIMANHLQKPDTEPIHVIQAQDDSILPGRKSAYCEIKSPVAEASVENCAAQEESHLATNSEILAAADKLAECQETITILSKQLKALKMPATSGPLDTSSICIPRPSNAASDYRPQSLASILAEEFADAEASMSPTTPKQQVLSKKDGGEVCATPRRSAAQQQENTGAGADDKDSMQIVVHPVFAAAPLRQDDVSADPKRKKKGSTSLLGRIMFRKRVEGGS
ncbi:filament-like plant protein 7 isoform X2 [Miscanthus floridulus]|uniref:filament-like plant protein 7 isoform X2 n=1 Tax=Miscanthus floridulus TaxID=154761 RepID=UPI00345A0E02